MFGSTKPKQKNNPPGPKAKAAARHRQFVGFVKSFGVDHLKPNARGFAAKRILHEARKYARA